MDCEGECNYDCIECGRCLTRCCYVELQYVIRIPFKFRWEFPEFCAPAVCNSCYTERQLLLKEIRSQRVD